jgi:hypothetical protein
VLFKRLSEYVVHLATLAEAEGRSLRHAVARLGLGFSITLVGAGLMLCGTMLLLAGIWLGMHKELGEAWASAITGVVALLMSGGAIYAAIRIHK